MMWEAMMNVDKKREDAPETECVQCGDLGEGRCDRCGAMRGATLHPEDPFSERLAGKYGRGSVEHRWGLYFGR
jgi:hypothetical protein